MTRGHDAFSAPRSAQASHRYVPKLSHLSCLDLLTLLSQLHAMMRDLDDALADMRLPRYYEKPRFHASLAWTLHPSAAFSPALLKRLDAHYGAALREERFDVDTVCLKIGQQVTSLKLC